MGNDFSVNYVAGGVIDKIKNIGIPDPYLPKCNQIGSKGFRVEATNEAGIVTAKHTFDKDIYLSDISVSCEELYDFDFWELECGTIKICETMFTLQPPPNTTIGNSFQLFPKILAGTEIKFSFHNDSGYANKVWMTLGYMYNIV